MKQTTDTHSSYVGGDITRIDSIGKVTGQAKYAEDISMPGLLVGMVLRSPHHHARLVSLDTHPAEEVPGVVRVITAQDIPGENGLFDYSSNEPILVPVMDTVRMIGAPVAFVVADTHEHALAGVRAIEVKYELLPHFFETEDALKPDAVYIAGEENVLNTYTVTHGDLDSAFAGSDLVLETVCHTTLLEHAAMERETTLGYFDEQDRVTVIGGTHEPHWQQNYIAGVLGLDVDRVRVIMPPTGGSFGGKQDPWPLVAAGVMTYLTGKPVRLAYSRRESFDASPKRHPYDMRFKIGATHDGKLTGIHVQVDVNTGGYDGHGQYIANYAASIIGGPYRWQAVDSYARTVYTNGPKGGQFRGFGQSQPVFGIECALDELIEKLGLNPVDFRLKNRITETSNSFLGYPIAETLGFEEVLETIRPRYEAFKAEVDAFNADRGNTTQRKGVGLAGMWHRFGKSGSLRVEAEAELAEDGHYIVYCSAPDYGQGINTVMHQFAAEGLGVSRDFIELINADTALTPDSGIQGASRATYWIGNAVLDATENLKLNMLTVAAEMMDCAPSELMLAGAAVACKNDPARSVTTRSVAQEIDALGRSRRVTGACDLSHKFPDDTRPEYTPHFVTGAQLAEVLVDMETGQVEVTRMVAVHDVGRAINPRDASGQIEGAMMMGLGAALREEYLPGQTTGFTDYVLPMIGALPEVEVKLVEVPSYDGPLGAKGLGEPAMLPTAPAIINAVSRAIGVRIRKIPATPERVIASLRRQPGSKYL